MRMLVVGAGSIGGLFGARLMQAGRDVTFLVRSARGDRIRQHGLEIMSPSGNFSVRPNLLTAQELHAPFDLILLSVKAYALEAALKDLSPAVGRETMILPVLNGMQHMDVLAHRFGEQALIGGACKAVTTLDERGRIVQLNPLQELTYGELDGTSSTRIQRLHAFMCDAGFDARLSNVILLEMWRKWALLSTLGGITCLMRGATGEIEAVPAGREFVNAFFDEVVSIIEAAGMPLGERFARETRQVFLTAQGPSATSSMYRDMVAGSPVEAEQLLGDLLRRGQQHRLRTPLVNAAYAQLCVYENRRTGAPAAPPS
jgi:2-dehydropantoate 2-reductase